MRLLIIALIFATLLVSCQKELSVENGSNRLPGLLIKSVAVTNKDTLVTLYSYDNLSRLETIVTDGISASEPYHEYQHFERDFTSRIINVKRQVTQSGYNYDTVRTSIHYPDPVGLEYDYSVTITNSFGSLYIDSTVYNFTGDRMMKNEAFTSVPDMGVFDVLTQRNEFTYDSTGNVITRNLYASTSSGPGNVLLTATFNYTYSDEPDYLWHSVTPSQNYWLIGIPNLLNKNLKQLEVIDQTGTGQNVNIITNLTLGPGNKPVTGEVIIKPVNQRTSYTFYYE